MKKRKQSLLILGFALILASCGEAQNTSADNPILQENPSLESFQIFRRGESSALKKLEVNNGDTVMLEARGNISEALEWFCASPEVGRFEKAGELRIVGEARFLVGARNSKASYYFVVETSGVRHSLSPTLSLPNPEVAPPSTSPPPPPPSSPPPPPTPSCQPVSCASEGKNCGTRVDGCGGSLFCGSCSGEETCGGGGEANVCGSSSPACTPISCETQGKNCGDISDGCGGVLNCGSCSGDETCGGAGEENVCGNPPGPLQPPSVPSDPYMDEVVSFNPGAGAGFGQSSFPQVVLGPPHGNGSGAGGTHVLSLGTNGQITLRSATPILNGSGPDFIVFENAFYAGGNPMNPFAEPGEVSVSQDGETFLTFPCQANNRAGLYPGCAGVHPTLANPDSNMMSPTDPAVAGGDAFDLEDLGLNWVLFVRITDAGNAGGGGAAGFDLDAISIVHQ